MHYANDNRRGRTPADEQFILMGIALVAAMLFITIRWLVERMLPSVIGWPGGFFRASRDLGCWQADFAGARGGVNIVVG